MPYVERFFKQIDRDGHVVRMSVKERVRAVSGANTPKEIGDFDRLSLQVQGQQAKLETPIIKTSLSFSMYDTIDKADTAHVKYGGWEQFYTPDQTLWLIELSQDGSLIWSGYITPDSWEDDLVYRGLITITARDMLGHMADFEVVESDFANIATDGMASVADIVQEAFWKAQVPMQLEIPSAAPWLTYQGEKLYEWGLDITALLGKNWYEAVEGILDAFGLTLRYSGHDSVILSQIRNVPDIGTGTRPYTPQFLRRSGHRELIPAYRLVTENLAYEAHADYIDTFTELDFFGSELNKNGWEEVTLSGGSWTVGSGTGVVRQFTAPNAFNDIVGDASRYFLLKRQPLTTGSSQVGLRRTAIVPPNVSVNLQMKLAHTYTYRGTVVTPYQTMSDGRTAVYVEWQKLGGTSLWIDETGSWGDTMTHFLYLTHKTTDWEKVINLDIVTPDMPGRLRVYFFEGSSGTSVVRYTRVGDFSISVNSDSIPQSLKVTTLYDSAQNMIVKRSPEFGTVPAWIKSAGAIRNGVYLMDAANLYPPVREVQWNGTGATLPLSVFVHMQHIAMHAKANNMLTGEVREAAGEMPGFDAVWRIYDRSFVLVSGTIEYTTGFVSGAVLMEFDPYDTVWAGLSVDYNSQDGEYRRPIGGGSSSSSSSEEGGSGSYVLPKATETSLGGVAVGYFPQGANLTVEIDANGNIYVPLTKNAITNALGFTPAVEGSGGGAISVATSSALGGIKIGYQATGANVPVQLSNEKAYVQFTRAAIVEALGFTPANEDDIGQGGGSGTSERIDRTAPKLRILKGESYNGTEYEVLSIEHPHASKTGAELVLMVFNRRTGARRKRSASDWYRRSSKKWSVAMGEDGASQLILASSGRLDRVRDYLVQEFLCDGYTSRASLRRWDYQDWIDRASGSAGFGWGYLSSGWRGKQQKRFGVALRVPNPDFEARAGISIHTQAGPDQHGVKQPRWLYSEVAPLTAQLASDKAIRFSILEP